MLCNALLRHALALLILAASGAIAEAAKLEAPTIAVPSGAITEPVPTLVWGRVAAARLYQVEAYDGENEKVFSRKVSTSAGNCTVSEFCRIVAPKAFMPGPQKWRVRAGNREGWGPWSGWASFSVGGPGVFESPSVTHDIVVGAQTVTSIEVDLPGPGAAHVTSTGFLSCLRTNSDGFLDVSTVVTDDPDDSALGVRPGLVSLLATIDKNQQVSMSQATGRVFTVEAAGKRTFYWRSNGASFDASKDHCTIFAAVLTVQFFPGQGSPTPVPGAAPGAGSVADSVGR